MAFVVLLIVNGIEPLVNIHRLSANIGIFHDQPATSVIPLMVSKRSKIILRLIGFLVVEGIVGIHFNAVLFFQFCLSAKILLSVFIISTPNEPMINIRAYG